jgi:hypothetical protein
MPHYKNGVPAEVGDLVKGQPYNTPHEIVGTVIQITEGTDCCNCIVAFVEPKVTELPVHTFYNEGLPITNYVRRVVGGRVPFDRGNKTYESENVLLLPKHDYGALRDFEKVG